MKVRIKKLNDNAVMPKKAHATDFGYDVVATSREEIAPNVWKYGIGLAFELEPTSMSYNIAISFRPRSSIYKTGLVLSNCIGTIDKDYRGEVSAIFYKVAEGEIYEVGDRIGQIHLSLEGLMEFEWADSLSESDRGTGGYGSTGR